MLVANNSQQAHQTKSGAISPAPLTCGDNGGVEHTHGTSWRSHLRARGHRLTPQRELVLAAVEQLGHGTPEEIHAVVAEQSSAVNISTVYRTLTLLDELELVHVVQLGDRAPVYHSKALPSHVHLSCRECGGVTDAEPGEFAPLEEQLRATHGFEIDLDRLVVTGLCRACRA